MNIVYALRLCENLDAVSWCSVIFMLCKPLHPSRLALRPTQLSV